MQSLAGGGCFNFVLTHEFVLIAFEEVSIPFPWLALTGWPSAEAFARPPPQTSFPSVLSAAWISALPRPLTPKNLYFTNQLKSFSSGCAPRKWIQLMFTFLITANFFTALSGLQPNIKQYVLITENSDSIKCNLLPSSLDDGVSERGAF